MQKLVIDVDGEAGTLPDGTWLDDVCGQLRQLGIDARADTASPPITGLSSPLDDIELNEVLYERMDRGLRDQERGQGGWYLHLLVARAHAQKYLGVMFDYEYDSAYREGCAIFVTAIAGAAPADYLGSVFRRTSLHEIGHVLNLVHPPAASAERGVMVQTHRLTQADSEWYRNVSLEYSASAQAFCRDNLEQCEPGGGFPFLGQYSEDRRLEASSIPEPPELDVKLLAADGSGSAEHELFEPVPLLLRLENRGPRPLAVWDPPLLSDATLSITLRNTERGDFKRLATPLHGCRGAASQRILVPGEDAISVVMLAADRRGLAMPYAGTFVVRALVRDASDPSFSHASTVLEVRVRPPRTRLAAELFHPAVTRALSLGGVARGGRGYRQVRRLCRSRAGGSVAVLRRLLAESDLRSAVRGRRLGRRRPERSRLEEAAEVMRQALRTASSPFERGRLTLHLAAVHRLLANDRAARAALRRHERDVLAYRSRAVQGRAHGPSTLELEEYTGVL